MVLTNGKTFGALKNVDVEKNKVEFIDVSVKAKKKKKIKDLVHTVYIAVFVPCVIYILLSALYFLFIFFSYLYLHLI